MLTRNLILYKILYPDLSYNLAYEFNVCCNLAFSFANELAKNIKDKNPNLIIHSFEISRDNILKLSKELSNHLECLQNRNIWNADLQEDILQILLVFSVLWDYLSRTHIEIAQKEHQNPAKVSKYTYYKNEKEEFDERRNVVLEIYKFCLLINERRLKNLPAWEGIRIVRERIKS